MDIKWYGRNEDDYIVSINKNNITLNKACSETVSDYAYCRLGFSTENKQLIIQPISYDRIANKELDSEVFDLYFTRSYSRIACTKFLTVASENLGVEFTSEQKKYGVIWNDKLQVLVVDIEREVLSSE